MIYKAPTSIKYEGATRKGEITDKNLAIANRSRVSYAHKDLLSSALCDEQQWSALDGDGLVKLYDDTFTELLDQQAPTRCVSCRRRPSNTNVV